MTRSAVGPGGAVGVTFFAMRAMQFAALVSIIGLTSNFISEIVAANQTPPSYLLGTLVVACVATLYISITFMLFYDDMLPLLAASGCDAGLLIALIVVACVVGKPVSYLSCPNIGSSASAGAASFFATVAAVLPSQESSWTAGDQTTCVEVKAVWGLAIALCVLFAFSAMAAVCLWRRARAAAPPAAKDLEG